MTRISPRLALRFLQLSDAELGLVGERIAERWLARRGLRVVARRLVTRAGEVDLLARDGNDWACVEVKTGRAGPRFRPGERVDRERLARLSRAAEIIAAATRRRARVDVVEVLLDSRRGLSAIVHHTDVAARQGSSSWASGHGSGLPMG